MNFEVDYRHDGRLRHETLVESILSPDIEFLVESKSEAFGYGADEGSLWFSKRNKIAAKIRAFAICIDKAVELINQFKLS